MSGTRAPQVAISATVREVALGISRTCACRDAAYALLRPAAPMKAIKLLSALALFPALASAVPVSDGSCVEEMSPLFGLGDVFAAAASDVPPPMARLVFDAAFGERVDDIAGGPGVLFAGAITQIAVSPARFGGCADGVTAFVKDASGAVTSIPMSGVSDGLLTGNFVAPTSGPVEIWFRASRPAVESLPDCVAWDSDYGRNYTFEPRAYDPARATFAAGDWAPSIEGSVKKGGALVIDYDPSRLTACRTSYMGNPTWSIIGHVRFADGRTVSKNVAGTVPTHGGPVAFAIPDDASGPADVWFENVGYYPGNSNPCRAYDSRYGENYKIAISN